ncbi:MAG: hypothetical protein JWP55_781, partial [Mycobacterium sp.]|nr:hypothetical protein [Mycobacterium sp.]
QVMSSDCEYQRLTIVGVVHRASKQALDPLEPVIQRPPLDE